MTPSRLSLALDQGLLRLPDQGVVVWGATRDHDLSGLPDDALFVTPFRPDHAFFEAAGRPVATEAPDEAAMAVIFLPRSKQEARGFIASAASITSGDIVVDGQKTDGIDSILRDLKRRGLSASTLSKAHGKLAVLSPGAALDDWMPAGPARNRDGFLTVPGVFSADSADPGSVGLAHALPRSLGRRVADLGAGWGYVAAHALGNAGIEDLHLIEADLRALDCARANIEDARAHFHWADALTFEDASGFDAVITNPPFHQGRAGDPGLGQGFIQAAARLLRPRGQLWLVANRHLPYERDLNAAFGEVAEIGGDRSYKLFRAARPLKKGARG